MARRRKRRPLPTVWLDWTPEVAGLFGLVPRGWSPPLRVRLSGGLQNTTVSARFVTPAGHPNTAHVRLGPDGQALRGQPHWRA